jgi:signal peptidase II
VRRLGFSLSLMAVLLALDQGLKAWVRAGVPLRDNSVLVPNLLEFTHVENRGVSFSVLAGLSDGIRIPLLVTFSAAAVAALTWYWLRHRHAMNGFMEAAFWLILPGALGNLIDRALFGTVTDYLHFRFYETSFFVNNAADIWISLGVVSYLLGTLLGGGKPGRRA